MGFNQYFSVFIFLICLITAKYTAQAQGTALKLSVLHNGEPCTNSANIKPSPPATGADVLGDGTLNCVVGKPYSGNLTLQCRSTPSLPKNLTLAWFKENSAVQQNDRIKIVESDGLVLNFTSVIPDDAGRYQCKAVKKGEDPKLISPEKILAVQIRVLPYVKNAHKDVTAVEGHAMNLTCVILSPDETNVTWFVSTPEGNKTYFESVGRVVLENVNSSKNALFHVKSANITIDRGTYICVAKSEIGESPTNTTFVVRIKSKYAALWPFLGICAEVIILCTIILIYEKKRDKSEMEESDTDQGPETKSSPDHGQDNVRYRK